MEIHPESDRTLIYKAVQIEKESLFSLETELLSFFTPAECKMLEPEPTELTCVLMEL